MTGIPDFNRKDRAKRYHKSSIVPPQADQYSIPACPAWDLLEPFYGYFKVVSLISWRQFCQLSIRDGIVLAVVPGFMLSLATKRVDAFAFFEAPYDRYFSD